MMNETERSAYLNHVAGLSLDALADELDSRFKDIHNSGERICCILFELDRRGKELPPLDGVFHHFRLVASGSLSFYAAWTLGRYADLIPLLAALPTDLQDRLAAGEEVPYARFADGRVVFDALPVTAMTVAQRKLALSGDGGLVSKEEQGEYLLKVRAASSGNNVVPMPPAAPKVKVSVDADRKEIVVNRTHLRIEDVEPALNALGYRLQAIRVAAKN